MVKRLEPVAKTSTLKDGGAETMIIQCVARLFVRVAYVGSLLIERGINSV